MEFEIRYVTHEDKFETHVPKYDTINTDSRRKPLNMTVIVGPRGEGITGTIDLGTFN